LFAPAPDEGDDARTMQHGGSASRHSEVLMATFSRRAVLEWDGDIPGGSGLVAAGSDAFTVGAIFPSIAGDPPGKTTPEELLAASHATCYGIGLRSLIARRGGRARRVTVTATVTAEKGAQGIRLQSSHLIAAVHGLEGIDEATLQDLARETEERCTISLAIRAAVAVSSEVRIGDLTRGD
jgi:lipoyl-dependent peroxiredoxin